MANELSNYNYLEDTKKLKQTIETSFLTLGERLSRIRNEKLFLPSYETFEDFLLDAKLSPATASKLINIYEKFYIEWKFKTDELVEAGGWSVVATLLPICKDRESAEEWLHKSHHLSRPDLEKEIKEMKTGIPMKDCKHEDSYVLRVCRTCGFKEKVLDNE